MKISSKNKNSITPLVIETNAGKRFEISGEVIQGGYSAYKDSLIMLDHDEQVELTEVDKDKYVAQILDEFRKENVPTKFEIS